MHRIRFGVLPLLISVIICPALAWGTPLDDVRETVEAVIGELKEKEQDSETRRAKIEEHIRNRFDFRSMSQRTLATNWKKATKAQKIEFTDHFSKLLISTYVSRIEAYTDERVEYVKEKIKGKKAVVDTLIITKTIEIPLNYKLIKRKKGWKIYDVIVEEVSLIRNYRSSYRVIVKKDGIDGLLMKIRDKVIDLNAKKGGP